VDKFIFVGEFARKKHISVDSGFKDKSVVLHNFTAIKGQEPSDKENYLLYFGRISKEKGISYLIKAVESLPNVNLKIAGQGPLLEALSKRHRPNIEFVGHKSGKELHDYIRKAMFVIVPSIWYENNPMAILEACTLGTPVIAGRIGGIPELIEDSRTGFLVEPRRSEELKEKIRQALALTAGEYAAMCNEAKAFAKAHFTPEIYYKKLFSIYNEVIENRK
jgi:glycosyltransferase involved in cell wall biosynthesis